MVHKHIESAKLGYVPCSEETEMITVGHPDAELLKVFLLREEKQALKDAASKQGQPMYHLVRRLILDWLEDEKKQAS
jgi:hypothetical protein